MSKTCFRVLAVSLLALPAGSARAQAPDSAWNSPRVLALIEHARQRRLLPLADSALQNYKAIATGHVYFYLDRQNSEEKTLVKADQIALEVYWAAPDRTKQRIVGLRDESLLPNRMHYHLDHLTVVQNGFGDTIRLGDGDEVRDVLHPAAPEAPALYDYRLTDSLTIRLPGTPEPVRVYQVQVRPKRSDVSALVGSIFVDRATGDIVRMSFTFTPASYVDRRLDYINISLDNIRWDGRYWLPYEQAVEIRRQIPELDFVAGAVIQGRFKVSDYAFNQELPPTLFMGYRVVAVPEAEREAYPFETGIFEDLRAAGLAPPPQMDEIRAQAARLMRERFLSGLPRLRLHLRDASSVFRYDRAEGTFLGAGLSYALSPDWRAELAAGYAFAAERPTIIGTVRGLTSATTDLRVEGYGNRLRDLGQTAGAAGAMNTLSAIFGSDYLDPYRAHGGGAKLRWNASPAWTMEVGARVERHSSAARVVDESPLGSEPFRPVRAIHEGTLATFDIGVRRSGGSMPGRSWSVGGSVEAGELLEPDGLGYGDPGLVAVPDALTFGRFLADARLSVQRPDRTAQLDATLTGGLLIGDIPAQRAFLLGGRRTLPGYGYRSFEGDAFGLLTVEAYRDLAAPWVRLRLTGAVGGTTWLGDVQNPDLPFGWSRRTSGGLRTSLGAGVGLFWDILRVDLARGLNGGDWELMVSVDPRLWSIL